MKKKPNIRPKGTFNNELAMPIEKRLLIAIALTAYIDLTGVTTTELALKARISTKSIRCMAKNTTPFTQSLVNKLLNGIEISETMLLQYYYDNIECQPEEMILEATF